MEQQKTPTEATVDVVMAVLVQNFAIPQEQMREVAEAISLTLRHPGIIAKCADIAEWHIADRDECGVLAREVYEAIKGKA